MIPLSLSVVCWGTSFFAGCRNRQYFSSTLLANTTLIQVRKGKHPEIEQNPEMMAAAAEGIKKAVVDNSNAASTWAHVQFNCLVLGVVLFVAWHILLMALRT